MQKRIGLDARALSNINRQRGIGRYTSSLINALLAARSDFHFVLFGHDRAASLDLLPLAGENVEWITLPKSPNLSYLSLVADHMLMAGTIARSRIDLFHAIDHNMTPFLRVPSIVTVHDLIPLVLRGAYLGPRSRLWLASHRLAALHAKAVVAVSNNTAADVERLWKIPGERLNVIPEGVSDIYQVVEDGAAIERAARMFGIKKPYFLYLGGFDPRKNIHNLLLAFKHFLLNDSGDYSLVLSGDTTGFNDYLSDEIKELGLDGKVVLTGFIDEEYLPLLYSGSEGFVCVSLYEGFGLPFLEAMACGTPVIASDTSSIPEVVGDAGLLVDPLKPDDIARGMEKVAGSLQLRDELRERGIERAAAFNWQGVAERILVLYSEVLGGV
ncbi:MAG: hypothetical protein A2W01_02030 [Candidatus Solincola sediminis]|uniref:Glycosyltransferase family 1 protein n=1 Tax=Candidatus Solincola sediminis TaxID=1797199 RepID=A0A1F2WJ38_9ACTN|nr:MAG: hypothetical protein A2Y75_06770 [Candidatus Solincola sediminis]OFW57556.1 MAG: hypothetical protein A2W01_02030 [Candidatus Solincola sediminis]